MVIEKDKEGKFKAMKIIESGKIINVEFSLKCESSHCDGVLTIKLIDFEDRYILYICSVCQKTELLHF